MKILPGSTLGMLGAGQLGRMFTVAARTMGYEVVVLDPDTDSPAGKLATKHLCADYSDQKALDEMGMDDYGYVQTKSKRYFSLRSDFPDQWYRLHNPAILDNDTKYDNPIVDSIRYDETEILKPRTVVLDLSPNDFLPN